MMRSRRTPLGNGEKGKAEGLRRMNRYLTLGLTLLCLELLTGKGRTIALVLGRCHQTRA